MANVLIVDDDYGVRSSLEAVLLDEQHAVHIACNGAEALSFLRADGTPLACYVVLLDIRMPVMDGIEFLEEAVRDERVWPRIRCLVMTASAFALDQVAQTNTHVPCLQKPFDIYPFLDVLETVIATLPSSS